MSAWQRAAVRGQEAVLLKWLAAEQLVVGSAVNAVKGSRLTAR